MEVRSLVSVSKLLDDSAELTEVIATAKRESIRDKLDKSRFLLRSECRALSPTTNKLSLGLDTIHQSFVIDPEVASTCSH